MKKLILNPKNNLLVEQNSNYQLNTAYPNRFLEYFPYSEIPKIAFDNEFIKYDMPKKIWLTDTTFRDGQQSMRPFTVKQIATIYEYLHKLSGPNGIIKQCEFFYIAQKIKLRFTNV